MKSWYLKNYNTICTNVLFTMSLASFLALSSVSIKAAFPNLTSKISPLIPSTAFLDMMEPEVVKELQYYFRELKKDNCINILFKEGKLILRLSVLLRDNY